MLLAAMLALLSVTAGLYDLRYRRIPNWLVVAGLSGGIVANIYLAGLDGCWRALGGFGLALVVYLPLYLLRAAGGGDVKLMAAVGTIVGARDWFLIFVLSAVFGGVAAFLILLAKGRLRRSLRNIVFIFKELAHFRSPHLARPELDVGHAEALTLPRGTMIGLASLAYLALMSA